MKLRIFQSGKGDCLLLTGADNKRILVDGGIRGPFREHVGPWLDRYLRRRGKALDVVYVSHIDADHIEGILELMDNLVEWVVHDHQRANGNNHSPQPDVPRPPKPGQIWHNAFHEQMDKNAGAIANMFAAMASVLTAHADEDIREFGLQRQNLATSKRQAILLSRRIGAGQLGVPLNPPAKGKLIYSDHGMAPFAVGGMKVSVVGPFEADLRKLRKEWNAWLEKNKKALEKIAEASSKDVAALLGTSVVDAGLPLSELVNALGQRSNVTTPNLASLMLLVEEGKNSVLLTGDGHEDDILKGLTAAGKLQDGQGLHVGVLKVQHHGSEHNLDPKRKPRTFPQIITADHYVFCGNGAHENPDLRVVKAFLVSRLGTAGQRSTNAKTGRRFKFWFSSGPNVPGKAKDRAHMKKVLALVKRFADDSGGKMRYTFLDKSSVEFRV